MHAPFINNRVRLAEAIARDILKPAAKPQQSRDCFACGRSFTYRGPCGDDSGRFCSSRCRIGFEAGLPPYDPDYASKTNPRWYSLPIGPTGFRIDCAHCRQWFNSRGLRCCSLDCERDLHRKQELEDELANDPFRAVKRRCAGCGGNIPNWRNGRRVSKATRFCSDRCRKKTGRQSDSPNPVLSAETAKKCPENGGFPKVENRPTPIVPSNWRPATGINPADIPDIRAFLRRAP
jgi:hypothetical protein